MKHALKIEDLNMNELDANRIVKAFKQFARDLGYSQDRISELDCRRRDGFIPFSHNKGGIECVAFSSQEHCYYNSTLFENTDKTIKEYRDYDIERFEADFGPYENWTDKQSEEFEESRMNDDEASVLFAFDLMYKGKEGTKHQANLRFTVCVKDAPYHRQYDDLISIDIEWTFHNELEQILNETLKRTDVKKFSANVEEAF